MKKITTLFIAVIMGAGVLHGDSVDELMQAARHGDTDKVEQLLTSGVDVNARNILGESALIFAIDECRTEAARLLLQKGAQTEFYTKLGYTPLMKAAAEGCTEIVKLLLNKNVDIDKGEPRKKFNALFKAAERGHADVVALLLDAGADVNHADLYGMTPLMIAAQKGHYKVVENLVDEGADVNAKSLIGQTALLCALDFGHPRIASFLIDNGADVSDLDKYNRSALMLAASRGYADIVKTLVEKGADLNVQTEKKETAALLAQKHKFDDIVTFLLQNGADSTGLVFPDTTKKELAASDLYDKPPEPVGGLKAIQRRLRYPKKAKNAGMEGTITINVTVDRRGRVRNTEVIDSFGDAECEKAAIRAIKNTRWKAAKKGKKSVEATIEVPVEFALKKKK